MEKEAEILISVIFAAIFDAIRDNIAQNNILQGIDNYLTRTTGTLVKWFGNNTWHNKYKFSPIWFWSTLGVGFTDSWHFFKYLQMFCIFNVIGLIGTTHDTSQYGRVLITLGVTAVYMSIFELTYRNIKWLDKNPAIK